MDHKTDKNTTFKELKDTVEKFCKERNWQNNDPRQLLISTAIELSELAEYYQWSEPGKWNKEKQKEISYELVDVLFYLFRFINKSEIDLSEAFFEKVAKLAKKYPKGEHKKHFYEQVKETYRKTGKNKLYE